MLAEIHKDSQFSKKEQAIFIVKTLIQILSEEISTIFRFCAIGIGTKENFFVVA